MTDSFMRAAATAAIIGAAFAASEAAELSRGEVVSAMEKSADFHMKNLAPSEVQGRVWHMKELPSRAWHTAAYYDGMIALSRATGNPIYMREVLRHGYGVGWTANPAFPPRLYHADDHAVGHAWLDIYAADKSRKERIEPFAKEMSRVIEDVKTFDAKNKKGHGSSPVDSWTWCDALFMAPPTLARLYELTGDKKYLDYMTKEFKWCYDTLYSGEDSLFYRDESYIGKLSPSKKKIFWSRGNGWVVGGLAQIIDHLPSDEPTRKFYEGLFVGMMKKIVSLQGKDGLWTVNLVDPAHYAGGETSGSGFFTFAIAWGINRGLLDRETYLPAAIKGWRGLLTRVHENGMVGYVQPVGASPDSFDKDTTHAYGIGVFLLAGSELAQTLGMSADISDAELLRRAQAIYSAKTPKAYVHIEPRRMDDILWENDKMAFRAYGPALKNSVENSGIDVWAKTVPYPVIDKWLEGSFSSGKSYHKDWGEGCDSYKVADSVGLGGTGIWKNGKLYKSDVYKTADVIWQSEDKLKFVLTYHYDIDGEKITEIKTVTLAVGDDMCKAQSRFIKGEKYWSGFSVGKGIDGLEVAVGIKLQNAGAKVSAEGGRISADDVLENKKAIVQMLDASKNFIRFERVAHGDTLEILAVGKTDKSGAFNFEFGYVLKK